MNATIHQAHLMRTLKHCFAMVLLVFGICATGASWGADTGAGIVSGVPLSSAGSSAAASGTTVALSVGWNLLGNSSGTSLDVASAFGSSTQVTSVWKWVPATSKWAFYAPSLSADGTLANYAAGKSYDVLSSVGAGEGFWVNAQSTFSAQLPSGTALSSASFRGTLLSGWNLIASGDNKTPSEFNQALNVAPPAFGTIPTNLVTLWSWDASLARWYFYAPSLEASGGTALSDYAVSKGYLNYGSKSLAPATGFWVNRSAPPAAITLASTSVTSALPMSVLTLNGTGFDTTAMTAVRFFDNAQYSVDVRPIRISSTSIAVAVPPYFSTGSSIFSSGTVSVKVTQTSGAGTRSSAALAGFQILDLPAVAGAAGAATLAFLQSLQTNAIALQTSGAGLGAAVGNSLADQASALALLINTLQPIVSGVSQSASIGTYQGAPLPVAAAELRQTDRLLLGTVLALGEGSTSLAAAGNTALARLLDRPPRPGALHSILAQAARRNAPLQLAYNGPLDRLAIRAMANRLLDDSAGIDSGAAFRNELLQLAQASSGGCMQPEAAAYAQCMQQGRDSGTCNAVAMASAPAQSTLCATSGAFGTGLAVVAAGLAAGVAIVALGFGTTAVAGTAGVLALAGYLAYATVATGMVQIGIGGTLGQASDAGKQMVVGGVKQLNDFVRDTTISLGVSTAAGPVAGIVTDLAIAGVNLSDALEQAVLPTTTSTSTSTSTTTSATTTAATTTSTIISVSTTTTTTLASAAGSGGLTITISSASCTNTKYVSYSDIRYIRVSASGNASGPVGTEFERSYLAKCSAWTNCMRQPGEPDTTNWTETWAFNHYAEDGPYSGLVYKNGLVRYVYEPSYEEQTVIITTSLNCPET